MKYKNKVFLGLPLFHPCQNILTSGFRCYIIHVYLCKLWLLRRFFFNFRYTSISNLLIGNHFCGLVVARSPRMREVVGSIPGLVIPKALKLVIAASPLSARHIYR